MSRLAIVVLVTFFFGCAGKWTPPDVDPLRGGDGRNCGADAGCVDLVVVLDTSRSTGFVPPSPVWSFRRGPLAPEPGTALWSELEGVSAALDALDRRRHAVAIVGFAGHRTPAGAAWVEVAMTDDFAVLTKGLERMRARGAAGTSCIACGAELAAQLLESYRPAPGRCSVLVVLSDGESNLPYGPARPADNVTATARAFRLTPPPSRRALVFLGEPGYEQIDAMVEHVEAKVSYASTPEDVTAAIIDAAQDCTP